LKVAEKVSPLAADRFSGESGDLVIEVGFAPNGAADTSLDEFVQVVKEARFVPDGAETKVRMFVGLSGESLRGFPDGVTRLHELLFWRKVSPGDNVDVLGCWLRMVLRERHG
jgi:hypothetical protein